MSCILTPSRRSVCAVTIQLHTIHHTNQTKAFEILTREYMFSDVQIYGPVFKAPQSEITRSACEYGPITGVGGPRGDQAPLSP